MLPGKGGVCTGCSQAVNRYLSLVIYCYTLIYNHVKAYPSIRSVPEYSGWVCTGCPHYMHCLVLLVKTNEYLIKLHFYYFIHKQAGTGKTHVTKSIVTTLKAKKKKVALCTSTGIAGLQYQGLFQTQTLHK